MKLFKFIARAWMDEFFKSGSLRVGTLRDFNRVETHGTSRGDLNDGTRQVSRDAGEFTPLMPGKYEPIVSEFFTGGGPGAGIQGIQLIVRTTVDDCYVFCTSYTFSDELLLRYQRDFQADACYVIDDALGYFFQISRKIKDFAGPFYWGPCTYTPEHIDYRDPEATALPAFVKRAEPYGWQREVRAVWHARQPTPPIAPFNIAVPNARDFARPFALVQDGTVIRL